MLPRHVSRSVLYRSKQAAYYIDGEEKLKYYLRVKLSSTDEHQRRRKSAFKAAEPIHVASGCSRLRAS